MREVNVERPSGLAAPVDSGVAGLSATAGVDKRSAVTISTTKMPSRETVESYQLTHIPSAPWCRACIAGRGREARHFRHGGGEETAAANLPRFDGQQNWRGHNTHACSV